LLDKEIPSVVCDLYSNILNYLVSIHSIQFLVGDHVFEVKAKGLEVFGGYLPTIETLQKEKEAKAAESSDDEEDEVVATDFTPEELENKCLQRAVTYNHFDNLPEASRKDNFVGWSQARSCDKGGVKDFASVSDRHIVRVDDCLEPKPIIMLNDSDTPFAFSTSSVRFQAGICGNMALIYDKGTKEKVLEPFVKLGHEHKIIKFVFLADNKSAAAVTENNKIIVWDLKKASVVAQLGEHKAPIIWADSFDTISDELYSVDSSGLVINWESYSGGWKKRYEVRIPVNSPITAISFGSGRDLSYPLVFVGHEDGSISSVYLDENSDSFVKNHPNVIDGPVRGLTNAFWLTVVGDKVKNSSDEFTYKVFKVRSMKQGKELNFKDITEKVQKAYGRHASAKPVAKAIPLAGVGIFLWHNDGTGSFDMSMPLED